MASILTIPWVDVVGYVGGAVTLWAMHSKTMIPLRIGVISGNVGFLVFGLLAPSYPILLLHALVLPLNTLRLVQMVRLIRDMRDASSESEALAPVYPYRHRESARAGSVLFRKGDLPDRMVVIRTSTVLLEEIGTHVGPGEVLGEIGAFTPENRRTCTAVCESDCDLLALSNETMMQLYLQNPRFGLYLMRLIVRWLLENWRDALARELAGRLAELDLRIRQCVLRHRVRRRVLIHRVHSAPLAPAERGW